MRKLKKTAALFCAAALTLLPAVPAFADFDQSVLDGVVLLYSGAPDEDGAMEYWRGTGFFVGEEGENPEYTLDRVLWWRSIFSRGKRWEAESFM